MSRRRKHVTLGLDDEVGAPTDSQAIVRAVGSRGSNLVEVEYPDGRQTLVMMPARFNKKLWVKRGGFLIIDHSSEAQGDTKVTGTIVTVLYEDHIKAMLKLPGVWPEAFVVKPEKSSVDDMMPASSSDDEVEDDAADKQGEAGQQQEAARAGAQQHTQEAAEGDDSEDEDDGLPPLQPNSNRKVVTHEYSESDDDDDGEEEE